MEKRYPKQDLARSLRKNQTDAEECLWRCLRNRQLTGYKFRRQYAIGSYIADFVCLNRWLIVEIDGGQHSIESAIVHDNARTAYMNNQGFRVLRFWNNDVLNNTKIVLESILSRLQEQPLTPTLSPERGEGDNDRYVQG